MGGSGGGGYYPTGVGGDSTDCKFNFTTSVFSPAPTVASGVNVDDILIVNLLSHPVVSIILLTQQGEQLGTITGSMQITRLIKCIDSGVEYEAKVLSKTGPSIEIQVYNK